MPVFYDRGYSVEMEVHTIFIVHEVIMQICPLVKRLLYIVGAHTAETDVDIFSFHPYNW
jgi:Flp pilus assembly secretin CpaC